MDLSRKLFKLLHICIMLHCFVRPKDVAEITCLKSHSFTSLQAADEMFDTAHLAFTVCAAEHSRYLAPRSETGGDNEPNSVQRSAGAF